MKGRRYLDLNCASQNQWDLSLGVKVNCQILQRASVCEGCVLHKIYIAWDSEVLCLYNHLGKRYTATVPHTFTRAEQVY